MTLQPFETPIKEKDVGICDECGEYTDDLRLFGGMWLCEKCADYV